MAKLATILKSTVARPRAVKSPKPTDAADDSDAAPDELVPDPVVRREFNVSAMTLWRWDHDPGLVALGLPPPVMIRNRKFRFRKKLEKFKQNILRRAIAQRANSPRAQRLPIDPPRTA